MSDITVVFKSSNPEEIEMWKSSIDRSFRRWKNRVDSLKRELRIGEPVIRTDFNSCWIIGYKITDGTPPKLGFRRDRKTGYVLPDESMPEGKEIAQRMSEIRYTVGDAPGLPDFVQGIDRIGPFKLDRIGADWFATLDFSVRKESLNSVDSKLWIQMQPAEYEAYKEITKPVSESWGL